MLGVSPGTRLGSDDPHLDGGFLRCNPSWPGPRKLGSEGRTRGLRHPHRHLSGGFSVGLQRLEQGAGVPEAAGGLREFAEVVRDPQRPGSRNRVRGNRARRRAEAQLGYPDAG